MKKITVGKITYLIILLNPLFDILSYFTRISSFSLSTILRPIIPCLLILYLVIKNKNIRKPFIIVSLIYLLYTLIHLYLYSKNITGISYGNVKYEMQYLINYTFLSYLLILFFYVFKKKKNDLVKYVGYMQLTYIAILFIALLTNTSSHTYVEAVGYKGWFNTGGAVGSVLTISSFIILPEINKKNLLGTITISLTIIYLAFFLGTRVGLYGAIIIPLAYIFSSIFIIVMKKTNITIKKLIPAVIGLLVLIIGIILIGSSSIKRREYLNNIEDNEKHIAYDLIDIREKIINNELEDGYMSDNQKKSLMSLYDYANKHVISNIDLRRQQLIYHTYYYINDLNVLTKLFGNGYLTNFGALTLEMEYPALLYNFGFIGLLIFGSLFIYNLIYGLYIGFKNIRNIDLEYMMYISGIIMAFAISTLAGHTFFNATVMISVVVIHVLLFNKTLEMRCNSEKNHLANN